MRLMSMILALVLSVPAYAVITGPGSNYFKNDGTVGKKDSIDIKVKNSAAIALAKGEVVCPDLTDDDGINVDFCGYEGAKAACVVTEAIAVGAIGNCRVWGYFDSCSFDASGGASEDATAGEAMFASGDGSDGGLRGQSGTDLFASTLLKGKYPVGVWLDSTTSSGSVECFIGAM